MKSNKFRVEHLFIGLAHKEKLQLLIIFTKLVAISIKSLNSAGLHFPNLVIWEGGILSYTYLNANKLICFPNAPKVELHCIMLSLGPKEEEKDISLELMTKTHLNVLKFCFKMEWMSISKTNSFALHSMWQCHLKQSTQLGFYWLTMHLWLLKMNTTKLR